MQLKGREKSSLAYRTYRQVFHMSCTSNALKPLILSQRTYSAKRFQPCNSRQRTQQSQSLDEWGGWEVSEGREGRRSGD